MSKIFVKNLYGWSANPMFSSVINRYCFVWFLFVLLCVCLGVWLFFVVVVVVSGVPLLFSVADKQGTTLV